MIEDSFVELCGRERAKAILDEGTFIELLGPFEKFKSTHLLRQGIVAQNDDGMIIGKGSFKGNPAVIISMEGGFQGGGIGEISGAKFAGALELALEDNKKGIPTQPIVLFDTGGVRLQEANYGLLAISEIQAAIVELRRYKPIIGIIPGKIGCFGGMSMTAGLFSYLIMTKEGRLTLNGPEVIEQEAGIEEWDSLDKKFTWNTIGGSSRVAAGFADYLVEDNLEAMRNAISKCIQQGIPVHRSSKIGGIITQEITKATTTSRGGVWFKALVGDKSVDKTKINSVLCGETSINSEMASVISVVPDENTEYPRSKRGEVGLQQGWAIASYVQEVIKADEKSLKRPIIVVVDVPSQAYGYREELQGIFLSCAAAVDAYATARLSGHPVITLIVGNAISGAFLAHGLQGSYMISLEDDTITVHAMSKKSAARITKRSIADMDKAATEIPAIAYDIKSFNCLGALNVLLKVTNHDEPSKKDIETIKAELEKGIKISREKGNTLKYRLETENAKVYRLFSIEVRKKLKEVW